MLVLIDLSSIAHPIWHTSQAEPDPNRASQSIVARVTALANGHPHVAICCDSGRSFRKDISPAYKANRPEHDATLQHQIGLACDQLAADGFPIWAVKGFEADDLIAAACTRAVLETDHEVLIVSADKDLLQLVKPRVRQMKVSDGAILDAAAVKAKLGVRPDQVCEYLMLVGDKSDNVKGADGIGPVRAADLLTKYETLDNLFRELTLHGSKFTPAIATALNEFRPRADETRQLISLAHNVEIPFADVLAERVAPAAAAFVEPSDFGSEETAMESASQGTGAELPAMGSLPEPGALIERIHQEPAALMVREPENATPAPAEWELQLDPRSMREARLLSKDMHDSRMFSAYGTPQGVLSTVILGRELGLPAMSSLRTIHIIEGKHALSASLMVALVLKSGLAEYFEPVTFDDKHATFVTKRKGARNEVTLTHTIEMAAQAGLVKDKSNWLKIPTDMLVARAQSRLARMVYPDLLSGLYTPDELKDSREEAA